MNAYLKENGDVCGITKNLTFHLARHILRLLLFFQKVFGLKLLVKCGDTTLFKQLKFMFSLLMIR